MKLTNTAKLIIDCSPNEFQSTIEHYTNSYNFVCNTGFKSSADFLSRSLIGMMKNL